MAQHYIDSLLGEREKIVHTARQHWFILARNILAEIIVIFLIFIGTIIASFTIQSKIPLPIIVLIGFVLMLLPIITMTRDILVWSNRQFIVTNRRVIQISGVINKNVTDSSLEKVNDVKMEQSAFGRMFNYGDIEILTASELGANLFKRIEKPVKFKTAMINAKENLERGATVAPREDIPALINQLDQLRQQGALTEEEFQQKKNDLLAKL
ncbi:MAG: PH domain-containing protein [Chloroflexota bacterium]